MKRYATEIVDAIDVVAVTSEWFDDHLPCVSANFQFKDGSNMSASFWWVDAASIAALHYYDSPRAREELIKLFTNYLEQEVDNVIEVTNDPSLLNDMSDTIRKQYDEATILFNHFNIPLD